MTRYVVVMTMFDKLSPLMVNANWYETGFDRLFSQSS